MSIILLLQYETIIKRKGVRSDFNACEYHCNMQMKGYDVTPQLQPQPISHIYSVVVQYSTENSAGGTGKTALRTNISM